MRARGVALGFCLVVLGCGYRFIGPGGGLPGGIERVFAPVVVNKTSEPGFEAVVTEALRERLMQAGALGGSDSPGTLEGELVGLGTGPALVRNVGGAVPGYSSYRVSATLRLTLKRGTQVLGRSDASGSEDYLPDAQNDVLALEAQRQAALKRLAETLVVDAYERLRTEP